MPIARQFLPGFGIISLITLIEAAVVWPSVCSRRIGDITGTIAGIAFQTKILALNAAVEAARAGEAGREFAVVAAEARALAQRSVEAAREIKAIISDILGKVDEGDQLVKDAGERMEQIVGQVRKVSELLGELSASSGEQTRSIDGVRDAVAQIDQGTQQNAALVEQSASAPDGLKQNA